MLPTFQAAPKCSTCGQTAYFAEQVRGPAGKVYHKRCLKCSSCSKVLDPGSLQDHEGDPYCRLCHSKAFGVRGYGVGRAEVVGEYQPRASDPLPPPASFSPTRAAPSPSRTVAPPAPPSPAPPEPHATPNPLPAITPAATPPPPPIARSAPPPIPVKPVIPPKPAFSNGTGTRASVGGPRTSFGGGGGSSDLCPRCKTVVYAAESVLASGSKWHKRCLRCTGCSTPLNGSNLVEKSGEPWCNKCHTKATILEQGMMTRPGLF